MLHQSVGGDVVPSGLRNAPVAFAAYWDNLDFEVLFCLATDRFYIVAYEADGAGAKDRDALRLEDGIGLPDSCSQLLLGAKDYVRLLDVCTQAVARITLSALILAHQVAARSPGEVGAADGAVGDVQDVFDRPENHPLGAGISATAVGQDARNAAVVGFDPLFDLAGVLDYNMLFSDVLRFLGKSFHHRFDRLPAPGNGYWLSFDSAHDMATLPLSPVLILTDSSIGLTKIRPSP